MRNRLAPLVLLLVAATACHSDQHGASGSRDARLAGNGARGPDPILIRIPRVGGTVQAFLYPRLDSVIWVGSSTPIERTLGFDPEAGLLAIVGPDGEPARIDLRMGEVSVASHARLTSLSTADGTDIYGINARGSVVRLARSGDWTFSPPTPARAIFPEPNGELIVAGAREGETVVWRIHPPETRILDSVVLAFPLRGVRTRVGDLVYFGTDTGLVGVRARTLSLVPTIRLRSRVGAVAPTPSGDRIYVTLEGERGVSVIDRYTDQVSGEIPLPGTVSDLRMDPLGRYLMARPSHGDSAWVIAIGTDRVVGSVQTRWTEDLPTCAPDGAIAVTAGRDVVFVDGETLQSVRTVPDGAKDFWYFTFWNGFRPRAAGLDQPVSFTPPDTGHESTAATDSTHVDSAAHDTAHGAATPAAPPSVTPPPSAAVPPTPPAATPAPPKKPTTFTVSFAALLEEQKARDLANSIAVNGAKARVVEVQRAGKPVYRVVLGPYQTRDAAEQAGRAAQHPFWVYADEP